MANDKVEVKGNCHCGQFRFTVQLAEDWKEKGVYACNCSVCSKVSHLLYGRKGFCAEGTEYCETGWVFWWLIGTGKTKFDLF